MARPGKLRIIGGEWRGRGIAVSDRSGLRPTPDRVRETLFNWLAPVISGARCLDAFAGTGALGLEALSRGAREVVFVERDPSLAALIEKNLRGLDGDGEVHCAQFTSTLIVAQALDVVFLDPPFKRGLLGPAAEIIAPHLAPGNRVYMEYAAGDAPELPAAWQILKRKQAGQVGYCLATYTASR